MRRASQLAGACLPSWQRPHVVPGNVAFGVGQPSDDLLPVEMMAAASARLFQDYTQPAGPDPRDGLQYADARGSPGFRRALAGFLGGAAGGRTVDPEALMITNGSSLGLNMCAAALCRPGETILCEQHTYFLARKTLEDNGLNLVGVPCDQHGIIVEALDEIISQTGATGLYCIPSFQNPTGTVLPVERRLALVELAQRTGLLLLCDDVYDALHWAAEPPPPLVEIARGAGSPARVMSIGSFSKIAGPGLRLGWLEASCPELLLEIVTKGWVDSGGGLNPITGEIVRTAMELGLFGANLDRVRGELQRRCAVLCSALRAELAGWEFTEPAGGYFVWVRLPDWLDLAAMQAEAQALPQGEGVSWMNAAVAAIPLPDGYRGGGQQNRAIRLSFAHYAEAELVEGVRRIAMLPSVRYKKSSL